MKIVLLSLKGLGDTLMQIPLIRSLHGAFPEERITVLVPDGACEELFRNCPYARPVRISYRKPGLKLLNDIFKLLYFLRAERFDVSITAFPSNRIWYNLLAFWTGAPRRITHSYSFARLRTLAFLQNCRVKASPEKHELENNLALLSCLSAGSTVVSSDLSPWLSPADEDFAARFMQANSVSGTAPIIGLHPSINKNQIYKAWGRDNVKVFAALIDWLSAAYGAKVILFRGPDEKEAADGTLALAAARPAVCEGASVNQAAALIKKCALFINTDSGLGHLAASVGTPCVTIFGPANPAMTAPYGGANKVVAPSIECAPCYDYPYESTYPRLKCGNATCMEKIDLDALKDTVIKSMRDRGHIC